jgi:hypothetical protein
MEPEIVFETVGTYFILTQLFFLFFLFCFKDIGCRPVSVFKRMHLPI